VRNGTGARAAPVASGDRERERTGHANIPSHVPYGARRARLDDASQADEAGGETCPHRVAGADLVEVVDVVAVAMPVGMTLTQDRFGHQVLFVHGGLLLCDGG
jgi:hypothetical protein